MAVATVVVFGTLAMFVYPLLAALLLPSVADADACFGWGIYTGASVHEVAQVADVAVITKMIRVLLLAPFLLALPWLMRRFGGGAPAAQKGAPALPWFALGFLGAVAANSPLLLAGMLALWLLLGGGTLSYLALRLFA